MKELFQYYWIRYTAAALVALAISVGAIISTRVREKANSLNLG